MIAKPGSTPEGPFDEETLKAKIAERIYGAGDYIWEESMPKWEHLEKYFSIPAKGETHHMPPVPNSSLLNTSKETLSSVSNVLKENINKDNIIKYADITNTVLKEATGLRMPDTFSFKDFFKEIFRAHSYRDFVALFSRGTPATTPDLRSINATWPSPWAFSRMLLICVMAFAAIFWGVTEYDNRNLDPAFLFIGTFSVPFCVIVFFYEMNIKQDIPFFEVFKAFLWGGILSLLISLYLFAKSGADAPYWAGLIEEPGKLLAAILIAQASFRKGNILHGMLIGCAVGAGFAAFETAGYVYRYMGLHSDIENLKELINMGVVTTPTDAVKYIISVQKANQVGIISDISQASALHDIFRNVSSESVINLLKEQFDFHDVMFRRAIYTPFCHVIWTAITAGAFWYALSAKAKSSSQGKQLNVNLDLVRGVLSLGLYPLLKKLMNANSVEASAEDFLDLKTFLHPKFYITALIPVLLHMLWNSELLFGMGIIRSIAIGLVSWFIALALLQVGILQVREEKDALDSSESEAKEPDAPITDEQEAAKG